MDSIDKYLYEDKITAKKIQNNPSYYDKLELAYNYFKDLRIRNIAVFANYSMFIDVLSEVTYSDIQAFIRFQNKEYYEYVLEKIRPNLTKNDFSVIKK